MTVIECFAIFLYIWLAVGFLTGVKGIFVEQALKDSEEKVEKFFEENPHLDTSFNHNIANWFLGSWMVFLSFSILMGPIPIMQSIKKKIRSWGAK